jgi:uncharacterized membrane protein YbhN (UPF0104 family)
MAPSPIHKGEDETRNDTESTRQDAEYSIESQSRVFPRTSREIQRSRPHAPSAIGGLLRRRGMKTALRVGLLALIVVFVGRSLAGSWGDIMHHPWHINWPLLVAGFLLLVAQELSFGAIWRAIVGRMGFALPWATALRIYLTAEFVRYIPGNVWHVLTRVTLAERAGVPKAYGFASMTVELATKLATAALTFALSLFAWTNLGHLGLGLNHLAPIGLAILGVPLLLVGLHPRLLEFGLNRALKLLKRDPIALSLAYRDIGQIVLTWLGSWLLGGLGFWLAVQAVAPLHASVAVALVCVGIYALGWDIGFLSFITPSGLFFREGAVALLLSLAGLVPDVALGTVIALLAARLLPTLAEILCVGGAYLLGRESATVSPTHPIASHAARVHRPALTAAAHGRVRPRRWLAEA